MPLSTDKAMPAASGAGIVRAFEGFLRTALRTAHALWLEITGFIFLVFSLAFLVAGVREYREAAAKGTSLWEVAAAAGLAAMFAYFGVSAFWRARRG